MAKFAERYNKLLLIGAANKRFEKQLTKAHITRAELFAKLAPLFLEDGKAGPYAPCLVHRHYLLEDGERMVTTNNSTKPSRDSSSLIVAERWLKTGEEIEHRLTDNPTSVSSPPSSDFFAKFNSIVEGHGIHVLGVCYAPEIGELAPGYVFWETAGAGDREQVLTIVHDSFLPVENTFQSSWIPTVESNEQRPTMVCTHSCSGCPP